MKQTGWIAVLLVCALGLGALTACGGETSGGETPVQPDGYDPASSVSLSLYDGEKTEFSVFDTVGEAVRAAEKTLKEKENVSATVLLSAGEHVLGETLSVAGPFRSGSTLTFRGAGTDKTTLTSAIEVDNAEIEDLGLGQFSYRLPERYRKDGVYPALRDLRINGKAATLAASPHGELDYMPAIRDEAGELVSREDEVIYLNSEILAGNTPERVHLKGAELYIKNVWNFIGVRIEDIDFGKSRSDEHGVSYGVRIAHGDWQKLLGTDTAAGSYYNTLAGNPYWIVGSVDYLTEPDTFVYDREMGTFTFQLEEGTDVSGVKLSVPMLDTLIALENVSGVTFEDLSFTGTTNTWVSENGYVAGQGGSVSGVPQPGTVSFYGFLPYAAICGEDVSDIRITDCNFTDLGNDGVSFRGAVDRVDVTGNTFKDIAGTAIRFGDCYGSSAGRPYDEKNHNASIAITENFIDGTGCFFESSVAVLVTKSRDLTIKYNTILNSAYSAISVGWGWRLVADEVINTYRAEIAYNYIENFMMGMEDGGAIYVVGGNASPEMHGYFNSVHHNFCVVGDTAGVVFGKESDNFSVLYMDGASTNWEVSDNVIYAHPTMPPKMGYINFQTVTGQQVYNCKAAGNYLVGSPEGSVYCNGYTEEGAEMYFLTEENNQRAESEAAFKAAFPDAYALLSEAGCKEHKGILREGRKA